MPSKKNKWDASSIEEIQITAELNCIMGPVLTRQLEEVDQYEGLLKDPESRP